MALDVSKYIFIDNHAHSLLRDHWTLDTFGLRQCFTESRSRLVISEHVQHSIHYLDMVSKLCLLLDAHSEEEVVAKRSAKNATAYVRRLWDSVSLGGLIVDDGFNSETFVPLKEFAEICQRPVFLCRRIEPFIERAIAGSNSFAELRQKTLDTVFDTSGGELVSLKSILAYRGGLAFEFVEEAHAESDFAAAKSDWSNGRKRIERRPLYHYLLWKIFERAGSEDIPVQLHIGLGDDDALITEANPALLQPLFKRFEMQHTKFVLLHCYPYVREAAMLASLYANVFMDLSLSVNLIASRSSDLILEALSAAPTTKLLAGTDGHSCPETHWYAALRWKIGLQSALNQLIMDGMISSAQAAEIAGRLLHDNARALYKLEGLA